jgi:S1-C subfamily serine protease
MKHTWMALVWMAVTSVAAGQDWTEARNLLEQKAPAIVTVKAVLKTEYTAGGEGLDEETRVTLQGVIVDASGLVMMSNSFFSTQRMMELFGGGDEIGADKGIKITPRDFKVTVEQDEKELSAFLAATDTQLDLCFIQIEGLGDRKLTPVVFDVAPPVTVGQKVFSVGRLQKGFDYAPYYQTATISGELKKPRKAWVTDGSTAGLGLPVFAANGDVIGALTTLSPGVKEEGNPSEMGMGFFMRMMTGGGGGPVSSFVLPAQTVKAVVDQAKKRAAEMLQERAKKGKGAGNRTI